MELNQKEKEFLDDNFPLWADFSNSKIVTLVTKDLIDDYMSEKQTDFEEFYTDLDDKEFWQKLATIREYLEKTYLGKEV